MRIDYTGARKLIERAKIEQAIELMLSWPDLDDDDLDTLRSLSTRYHLAEREKQRGIPVEETALNQIVAALYAWISSIAKERLTDRAEKKRARLLLQHELALEKGYDKRRSLLRPNGVDALLRWMWETHLADFEEMVQLEPGESAYLIFARLLAKAPLEQLITKYGFSFSADEWRSQLLQRRNRNPSFVGGWLEYRRYRDIYAKKIEPALERVEKDRQALLTAGSIGLLLGGLAGTWLQDPITSVIEQQSEGEEETEDDDDLDGDD